MSTPWYADEVLATNARTAPNDPALYAGDGVMTWAELDARATAVAASIRREGLPAGARVALTADEPAVAIPAILGVLRAGAVAAPLPVPQTTRERGAALAVLEPALVVDATSLPSVPGAVSSADPAGRVQPVRDPEDPAVVVLTSGTTGRPRGVVLSARALAASADAWLAALPTATGWALPLGLAHVAGLGILWRAIRGCVPVRILPPADPIVLLRALVTPPAPSHLSLVPAQLARALDVSEGAAAPATLRAVLLGGGPIPAALVTRALRAGWPVVPTYGLSETASGVTALPTGEAWDHPGSAGRPLPGVHLVITGEGRDGVGEIVVETPARSSGYVGTLPDHIPATEPLRTGDLGRLDAAGRLVVEDRRTDRIVRGGENISPAEVEQILETHPSVAEAAVVGRPDELWGQVPVAAIVLDPAAPDPGDADLAALVHDQLAGFKVPIAFRRLDALPRTPGGKLRRDSVRALLAGGSAGELARPDGDAIGWRLTGTGSLSVVLLHGTLSTSLQLNRLAAAIAAPGGVTVHALDRRGSGTSRLAHPTPLDIEVHVGDLIAYLDARGIGRVAAVGVSFGGVLALETAARHPARVSAVVAYEPPYRALAGPEMEHWFRRVADDTVAAHAAGGAPAAAETFLRWVAGNDAWDRLPGRGRATLEGEGDGALADAGLGGLDAVGLARITARVAILTGGESEPFYAPIADAVAAHIPGARRETMPGARHTTPITDPGPVAARIRACLELPE